MEMRRPRLLAALALVATFVAGGATSVAVMLAIGPPHPPRHGLPPPLSELGLTPTQATEAQRIIDANGPAVEEVLRDVRPRLREVQDRVERDIRAILTEEQRRRLDALKEHAPPPPLPR